MNPVRIEQAQELLRARGIATSPRSPLARVFADLLERVARGPARVSSIDSQQVTGLRRSAWFNARKALVSLGLVTVQELHGTREGATYDVPPPVRDLSTTCPEGRPPPVRHLSVTRPRPVHDPSATCPSPVRRTSSSSSKGTTVEDEDDEERERDEVLASSVSSSLEKSSSSSRSSGSSEETARELAVECRRLVIMNRALLERIDRVFAAEPVRAAPRATSVEVSDEDAWDPTDSPESRDVFRHVQEIVGWAVEAFGANGDPIAIARWSQRHPYERVRRAVADVLLKRRDGFAFRNPLAILTRAITDPAYKAAEGAAANLREVLEQIEAGDTETVEPPLEKPEPQVLRVLERIVDRDLKPANVSEPRPVVERVVRPPRPTKADLQARWRVLPEDRRSEIRARARSRAEEFVGAGEPLRDEIVQLREEEIALEILETEGMPA